jgi:hypothetical protein
MALEDPQGQSYPGDSRRSDVPGVEFCRNAIVAGQIPDPPGTRSFGHSVGSAGLSEAPTLRVIILAQEGNERGGSVPFQLQ